MAVQSPRHGTNTKWNIAKATGHAAGKKPSVSLSLSLEVNNLEIDHEPARAATCFWAQAVWTDKGQMM